MDKVLIELYLNDVKTLARRSDHSNLLHRKWVYTTKSTSDGKLYQYNARLVAHGNEQVFGDDFALPFAAIIHYNIEIYPCSCCDLGGPHQTWRFIKGLRQSVKGAASDTNHARFKEHDDFVLAIPQHVPWCT